ncbi:hypothetical protein [Comamonas testosteroni]|uniref:hypothetical protein n=1 Tax=Comamonas testosteroni TaxID=285 RepID=UPI0005B44541|nr:hypothetical protein [Comamonas testosteroni]
MINALLTNQRLVEVLGLQGLSITSMDIACRVGELPRVTAVINPRCAPGRHQVTQFRLIGIDYAEGSQPNADESQPFDLDAMCKAAKQRIEAHINQIADKHLVEMTALDDESRRFGIVSYVEGGYAANPSSSVEACIRSLNSGGHLAAAFERTYGLKRKGQ